MNLAKVVKRKPARDSRPVVFPLFREGICQANEPAKAHTHTEVLALDNRRADALGIRLPEDWDGLHGCDFCGAVPRFAFLRASVDFYQHRVTSQPIVQRRGDRGPIRCEAIS